MITAKNTYIGQRVHTLFRRLSIQKWEVLREQRLGHAIVGGAFKEEQTKAEKSHCREENSKVT